MNEEKQKVVWKLSGGYTQLEGFEPLIATPPSPPPQVNVVVNGEVGDKEPPIKDQEQKAETTRTLVYVQNPLHTFPRNFPEVAKLLQTCCGLIGDRPTSPQQVGNKSL